MSIPPASARRVARADVGRRLLVVGALVVLAISAPVALVAWLGAGTSAALSALAGLGLAVTFLSVGLLGLMVALRGPLLVQPPAAMSLYALQILVLLGILVEVDRRGGPQHLGLHGPAFAIGALLAVLVWQAALAVVLSRARTSLSAVLPGEHALGGGRP